MVSNVSIWRTILGYKRTVSDLASLWTRFLLFRCILWRGAIGCWFLIGAWCALIGVCVVIRSVFLTHCGVGVHIDKKVIYLSFRNPDVNYVWTALWLGSTCSRSSFIPPHIFYLLTHSCIHLPPPDPINQCWSILEMFLDAWFDRNQCLILLFPDGDTGRVIFITLYPIIPARLKGS